MEEINSLKVNLYRADTKGLRLSILKFLAHIDSEELTLKYKRFLLQEVKRAKNEKLYDLAQYGKYMKQADEILSVTFLGIVYPDIVRSAIEQQRLRGGEDTRMIIAGAVNGDLHISNNIELSDYCIGDIRISTDMIRKVNVILKAAGFFRTTTTKCDEGKRSVWRIAHSLENLSVDEVVEHFTTKITGYRIEVTDDKIQAERSSSRF